MILFIDPEEEKQLDLGGGCIFTYREASGDDVVRLERAHRDADGLPDWTAAANAMLVEFVTGWVGVTDSAGNEIPFSAANLARLAPLMKGTPKLLLRRAIEAVHTEGKGVSNGSDESSSG